MGISPCRRRGRGGGGRRSVWVACRQRRGWGGGCRRGIRVSLMKARAGWGRPAEACGIPCEDAGGVGGAGEVSGYPS